VQKVKDALSSILKSEFFSSHFCICKVTETNEVYAEWFWNYETYSSVGKLLYKLLISLTQPTFLPLSCRSLSETFIRRSMINSSSGSCHDSDATW